MASFGAGAQIDLISPAEDRYLVRLLAQALELRQVTVKLREPGDAATSDIGVGVLTRAGRTVEQWQQELGPYPHSTLIAFEPHDQIPIEQLFVLNDWPSRSSDAAVTELARLFRAGRVPGKGDSAERARRAVRRSEPSAVNVLLALAVVAGLVVLLLLPLQQTADQEVEPPAAAEPVQARRNRSPELQPRGSGLSSADHLEASVDLQQGAPAMVRSDDPAAAVGTPAGESTNAPMRPATVPARKRLSSTVRRFCMAQSLEAAQAWLGVFSRQDHVQAAGAGCAQAQLRRYSLQPG